MKIALPFFIFMLIIALLWKGLTLHPTQVPSPLINKPVPTFKLPTLNEGEWFQSPTGFLGKITLLNVWATWCYACAEEHPLLMKLSHHSDFVLQGYLYKDGPNLAKQWLAEQGNPFQKIIVDQSGQRAIDWGVYGTPETFLIDKKGIVRYKLVGPITEETWQQTLSPLIQTMRNEP